MKFRSNSMAAAAATLLLATTCVVAQDGHDQRQARQEQRREQRQENRDQRGFQPPAGKSRGFGAQPTGNVQPSPSLQQSEAQRNSGNSRLLGPGPHAGDWLRRNRGLPLNQQMQQLQNDPRFRNLPPQQQQHLEQRLRQFNSMSPQQQDRFLDHVEEYEHMPPGARQEARELYRREQSLPASRQQAVHNAVHELDGLSPQERQQRLSSPEFRSRFTDTEREIIGQAVEMEPRPNQPPPNRQPAPPEQP